MNKRCPNTQQILLCDCTEGRCQVKEDQKKLLIEIMEADKKDGLYKQQTAVDYLLSQLPNKHQMRYILNQKGVIKKAKEMEREQIQEAWRDGNFVGRNGGFETLDEKQYYNETYGK